MWSVAGRKEHRATSRRIHVFGNLSQPLIRAKHQGYPHTFTRLGCEIATDLGGPILVLRGLSAPAAHACAVRGRTCALQVPLSGLVERIRSPMQERRQSLEVVAGSHHRHRHRGPRLSDRANELAAHVPDAAKRMLDPGTLAGDALVAPRLAFAQGLARPMCWRGAGTSVASMAYPSRAM